LESEGVAGKARPPAEEGEFLPPLRAAMAADRAQL